MLDSEIFRTRVGLLFWGVVFWGEAGAAVTKQEIKSFYLNYLKRV